MVYINGTTASTKIKWLQQLSPRSPWLNLYDSINPTGSSGLVQAASRLLGINFEFADASPNAMLWGLDLIMQRNTRSDPHTPYYTACYVTCVCPAPCQQCLYKSSAFLQVLFFPSWAQPQMVRTFTSNAFQPPEYACTALQGGPVCRVPRVGQLPLLGCQWPMPVEVNQRRTLSISLPVCVSPEWHGILHG